MQRQEEFRLPRPRAVIFDWDDTIVDNWPLAVQALNATLVHMGSQPWSDAQARERAGGSARDMFMALFGDRWQEADRVFYATFDDLLAGSIRLHPHIADILALLAQSGAYLAVVSNKRGHLLREEAAKAGFDGHFSSIIGAGDAVRDKPDPAPVHLALQGSGIAPGADVWFVGDSHTDMACALNTGCTGVLLETKVPPPHMLVQYPPSARFATHANLMEYIKTYLTR